MNIAPLRTPVEINPNDVLADFGMQLDDTTVTVYQRNNEIATVQQVTPLTPPSIEETVDNYIMPSIEPVTGESLTELVEAPQEIPEIVNTEEENPSSLELLSTEELLAKIPLNSKAFEMDESTSRFSGAEWYKAVQNSTVLLAGLGGIGSWVFMMLSRMKPDKVFLYDDDYVELANLSGQLYSTSLVGRTKVDAMASIAKDFSDYGNVIAVPQKFTNVTPANDIMICGFDNMAARSTFFNVWLNYVHQHKHPENCLFIDGRLALEEFQVFCIEGRDSYNMKRYSDEYLFCEREAENEQCSRKQTTYCSNMIGSVIVNLFTNFIANTLNPIVPRDLPFKTYYNASMMYFKTEA